MGRPLHILSLLLFFPSALFAQSTPVGTWGIATIVLPGDSSHKWGGYSELQVRENNVFSNFMYDEVKAGISYDLNKRFYSPHRHGPLHHV